MLKRSFIAAFVLMNTFFIHGQDITDNTFGDGLVNLVAKDSSFSSNFTIRMQSLFTSQWDIPESGKISSQQTHFLIRRARLKFKGFAYTPKLEYKFQLGLSNRDISNATPFTGNAPGLILDAVLKWNFYGNFELWAGQTKLPGNREQLISSGSLETVDRSLVNSYFDLGRGTGIQLHHQFVLGEDFIVMEALSLSTGEGRNVISENLGGYQYTARAEIRPFGNFDAYSGADLEREQTPKLALGISYDFNNNAVRTGSNSGSYMLTDSGFFHTDISTFFIDAILKYRGFSLMGEYGQRSADQPFAQNPGGSLTGDFINIGKGYNLQAGYLFKNDLQLVGRYTHIDLDDEIIQEVDNQYTLAFSKYFFGHNLKLQTDLSYSDLNSNFNDGLLYRLQLEIQF